MIAGVIQPKEIFIDEMLSLVKYYPYYKRTLEWYQDLILCKQVDNIDFPYDMERLGRMYRGLSQKGECYYIKYKENGRSRLVGDISLCDGMIGIVVCKDFQNRHIGRKAVVALLARAAEIGLKHVDAEIYDFNQQSAKMFTDVGFQKIDQERYRYTIET